MNWWKIILCCLMFTIGLFLMLFFQDLDYLFYLGMVLMILSVILHNHWYNQNAHLHAKTNLKEVKING